MNSHSKKHKFQVFTPAKLVSKMLDSLGYCSESILGKKVLENSFGKGAFLEQAISRYIEVAQRLGLSKERISRDLEQNFVGFEIDENLIMHTKRSLNKIAKNHGIADVRWNLIHSDFLESNLSTKFDFIFGNPPYIRYQDLCFQARVKLRERFITCSEGKFDYCYAFIEKSIKLMGKDSKMAYLIPSSIFKNVFARKLRKFMVEYVENIDDFSGTSVFSGISTSSAIIYLQNRPSSKLITYHNGKKVSLLRRIDLDERKWVFCGETNMVTKTRKFEDFFKIQNSPATLLNKVFVHKSDPLDNNFFKLEDESIVERGVLLDAFSPRNVSTHESQVIIFPYDRDQELVKKIPEKDFKNRFPYTYQYLSRHKSELQSRSVDNSSVWYEYGRSQGLSRILMPKIMLSSVFTDSVIPVLLDEIQIPFSGFFITRISDISLEDCVEILKSPEMKFHLDAVGISVNGKSKRISVNDINDFHF